MTSVEVEYCVPCGMLPKAQDVQHSLLETFGEELDRVSLVTGDSGVFRVTADDELLFDKAKDDYDVDEITRRVKDHL